MLPEDLDPPDPRVRRLRWAIAALLVIGFGACVAKGANTQPDPTLEQARIGDFGEIGFEVIRPDGSVSPTTYCALHAATDQQRQRGLMEVTDMRGYAGMLFTFPGESQAAFHMRNTPMPLSIAWFGEDGGFVSATDMQPCAGEDECPSHSAAGPYRYALEVPQGELPEMGIGPGSELVLKGPCPGT